MDKPAIAGGTPVRKSFLVFGKPAITNKEITEVVKTIKSGWLGTGPKTKQFEESFAEYIGAKHAIALNSCTAGLHLALDLLGTREGDQIITTPMTFAATANVIIHHRAKPIFVDIEKDTWNIDPEKIEEKITKKTRGIITVDLHGRPCNYEKITKIARKYKLFIIDDAAHAIEAVFQKKHIGTIADITAFSFYVTKNLTTVEGGMITTNKNIWAHEGRIRSLHGISKDAWRRYSSEGFKPYETLYPGYKHNMTDIQASFGIHQLAALKKNFKVRCGYWNMYTEAFLKYPELILPAPIPADTEHARHLYAILLRLEKLKISRNQFIDALQKENIGAGIHFTTLHLHKYYKESFGFKKGDFPNSEFVSDRTISLPLSPAMTKKDVYDVIRAVGKIITYFRK